MAAATFQAQGGPVAHAKLTKSRGRVAVKPILKKLQSAHSEKNSLDLDRSWEDQAPQPSLVSFDRAYGYGGGSALDDDDDGAFAYSTAAPWRSARDVSFTLASNDMSSGRGTAAAPAAAALAPTGTTVASGGGRATRYSHARSTSGTSHVSIATTSSGRNGSFVHPFQQTPRTSTPPLSYATLPNPLNLLDGASSSSPAPFDSSPTITEDADFTDPGPFSPQTTGTTGTTANTTFTTSSAAGAPAATNGNSPRIARQTSGSTGRPSLGSSQRTGSLSDTTPPLRVTNARSNSGAASRLYGFVNHSRSDLNLASASPVAVVDSPLSATAPIGPSPHMSTTSASFSPMSPLRNSLDMNGFRIRSRSELDTLPRQEQVRQARRRWEEKEKAKEEKYAREQDRKRERADTKETLRNGRAQARKGSFGSFGNAGLASGRTSSSTDARRPSASRRSTGGTGRLDGDIGVVPVAVADDNEKPTFASRGYDIVPSGQTPRARADDVQFGTPKRARLAKKKTTGAWTAFVLWLRTRLLKLGRR